MKHESKSQKGLFYWAESTGIGGVNSFSVVSQVDGYEQTEAWDDWFANEEDADEIAQRLANDDPTLDLTNQF